MKALAMFLLWMRWGWIPIALAATLLWLHVRARRTKT
jgi:hypothetical protein